MNALSARGANATPLASLPADWLVQTPDSNLVPSNSSINSSARDPFHQKLDAAFRRFRNATIERAMAS